MMHKRFYGIVALTLLAVLLAVLNGCQTQEKHYVLRGRVVDKSAGAGQLSVDGENIPGFMAAMIMPYSVKDPEGLAKVKPGDRITADVVVKNNNYWLERLTITHQSGRGSVPAATTAHEPLPGEAVPDIPLINQDGKTLHLGQFKGKAVLLTFIYTRCPFPTYCPLISTQFAAIQNELAKSPADYDRTHLVSITLDPDYDTPPVLRKYGLVYLRDEGSGFAHWDFVSTTPADLHRLASAFGLAYFEEDNQISHSMKTILLAPDGTVAETWPDNEWKALEVAAALKKEAAYKQ
jgi:protein SCO1